MEDRSNLGSVHTQSMKRGRLFPSCNDGYSPWRVDTSIKEVDTYREDRACLLVSWEGGATAHRVATNKTQVLGRNKNNMEGIRTKIKNMVKLQASRAPLL